MHLPTYAPRYLYTCAYPQTYVPTSLPTYISTYLPTYISTYQLISIPTYHPISLYLSTYWSGLPHYHPMTIAVWAGWALKSLGPLKNKKWLLYIISHIIVMSNPNFFPIPIKIERLPAKTPFRTEVYNTKVFSIWKLFYNYLFLLTMGFYHDQSLQSHHTIPYYTIPNHTIPYHTKSICFPPMSMIEEFYDKIDFSTYA